MCYNYFNIVKYFLGIAALIDSNSNLIFKTFLYILTHAVVNRVTDKNNLNNIYKVITQHILKCKTYGDKAP